MQGRLANRFYVVFLSLIESGMLSVFAPLRHTFIFFARKKT